MTTIRIKETQEIKWLEVIDPATGINWFADFASVGCNDEFNRFENVVNDDYDGEDFEYEVSQETYDWWAKVSSEYEAAQFRLHDMREEYGTEVIEEAIADCGYNDLEDQARAINSALDAFLEERQ